MALFNKSNKRKEIAPESNIGKIPVEQNNNEVSKSSLSELKQSTGLKGKPLLNEWLKRKRNK